MRDVNANCPFAVFAAFASFIRTMRDVNKNVNIVVIGKKMVLSEL